MQLDKLIVRNFGSFKYSEYEYQDGLWLIEGINEDKEGSSNGSGKSFFFSEAITWLLFEQTCRGLKFNDVIKNGEEKCVITGIFDNGLTVTRSKARSRSSTIDINDNSATQQELDTIIGMDFNTFTTSVIHAQSFRGFAELSETEQKSILTNLMDLDIWDTYKSVADDSIKKLKQHNSGAEAEVSYLNKRLKELENKDYSALRKEFEAGRQSKLDLTQNRIKATKVEILALQKSLESITKKKNDIELLKIFNESISEKLEDSKVKIELLSKEEKESYSKISNLKSSITSKLESKKKIQKLEGYCPLCSTKVTEESKSVCIHEINKTISDISKVMVSLVANEKTLLEEINTLEEKKSSYHTMLTSGESKLNTIYGEIKSISLIETSIKSKNSYIKELETSIEKILKEEFPGAVLEKDTEKETKKVQQAISECEKDMQKTQEAILYYEFWSLGFSSRGIKSYIFDSILPEFTDKANKYIQALTDSDVVIQFDTQKEKKSGGFIEKFTIMISDSQGERAFSAWSGGEKKRITIAVDLALADMLLVRSTGMWDFVVFDECFDGLDEEGKDMMMYLLYDLINERKRVYVISHDPTIRSLVNNRILVKKKDGESRIWE